jgi:hypothetical protein
LSRDGSALIDTTSTLRARSYRFVLDAATDPYPRTELPPAEIPVRPPSSSLAITPDTNPASSGVSLAPSNLTTALLMHDGSCRPKRVLGAAGCARRRRQKTCRGTIRVQQPQLTIRPMRFSCALTYKSLSTSPVLLVYPSWPPMAVCGLLRIFMVARPSSNISIIIASCTLHSRRRHAVRTLRMVGLQAARCIPRVYDGSSSYLTCFKARLVDTRVSALPSIASLSREPQQGDGR